ncbi:MAG TPA: response regulator [Pirellulaceae bacterium]|jgi:CheY-like chemotaxis protein|nr:response regulator [Pirellulaceae bacterium]
MKLQPPSLLITDDDRDFRETLRGVFEPRGYQTLLAADGDEALDIVQRQAVHLVLLDMHMPRLSGLETIRRIRQLPLDVVLPCILISAALDAEIEEEARRQRAFSVLSKPVRLREITGLVQQALFQTYDWRPDVA